MQTFSDYIVYVDESGDTGDDPEFPVFCLAFCIFTALAGSGTAIPIGSCLICTT